MNPIIALAHAAAMRPTLTSAAEWKRLARAAVEEHDRVCAELAELKLRVRQSPKFQGMTELA